MAGARCVHLLCIRSSDAKGWRNFICKTIRRNSNDSLAMQSKSTKKIYAADSRLLIKRQHWLQCTFFIVIYSISPTEPMTNCQIQNTHLLEWVVSIAVSSYAAFHWYALLVAAIVAAYRITNTIKQLRQLQQFLALYSSPTTNLGMPSSVSSQ